MAKDHLLVWQGVWLSGNPEVASSDWTFAEEARSLRCEVRDPSGVVRAVFGPLDEWATFTAEQGRMGYESISLKIPSTHPLLSETYTLNAVSKTFYERPARWTLWVVYRDYDWRDGAQLGASRNDCFAKGSILAMEDEDIGEGGSELTDVAQMVTITAQGLCDRTIGQRQTMHASWARYKKTGGPLSASYFVKHLVDEQTDNTKRPPGYLSAGGDATDYGSLTRGGACVLESSVATTLSFLRVDSGQSVLDTARELSKNYDIGWSFRVSPTGNTWRLHLYDGQGTNRTSSVIFSRSAGNLYNVKRSLSYEGESNTSWVAGKGTRERQLSRIGWSVDSTSKDLFGTLETGERHDSAWENEIAIESNLLDGYIANTYERWEAEIRDQDDLYFGYHYAVGDTVTITDEARGLSTTKNILVAQVDSSSPSRIRFLLGDLPSRVNDAGGAVGGGRSSRGGVGHRRAGGTTAPLVTEQEVFQRICCDEVIDNTVVNATQANTPLQIIHNPDTPNNPIWTTGVNNGEEEDKIGQVLLESCGCELSPGLATSEPHEICIQPSCETTTTVTPTDFCCTPTFPANTHVSITWTTPCDCEGYVDLSGLSLEDCCPSGTLTATSTTTCDEECDTIFTESWDFDAWTGLCMYDGATQKSIKVPGFLSPGETCEDRTTDPCPLVNG